MKHVLLTLIMVAVIEYSEARPVQSWTYEQMFEKADLVVIATVVSTSDSKERSVLRDLAPPLDVNGVITTFRARLILKGNKEIGEFRLHHYRLASDAPPLNGPQLLHVESEKGQAFLLFLSREPDGSFAPVTGQTDPAIFSALELKNGVS